MVDNVKRYDQQILLPPNGRYTRLLTLKIQEHLRLILESTRTSGKGLVTPASTANNLPFTFIEHGIFPAKKFIGICDFGGEWTGVREDTQIARKRALASEGFFYFLDPRQSSDQYQRLTEFHSQLREEAGKSAGRPLNRPGSNIIKNRCIRAGKQLEEDSLDLLRKLRNSQNSPIINLPTIYERSNLVSEHLKHLFPDWDIERRPMRSLGIATASFRCQSLVFSQRT